MTSSRLLSLAVLLLALSSALSQTFQYSRGWTNGKRSQDGHKHGHQDVDLALLQRIFSNPCQMEKLKYTLEGKPISDKLLLPCEILFPSAIDDQLEDASEIRVRRTIAKSPNSASGSSSTSSDQIFDNYQ